MHAHRVVPRGLRQGLTEDERFGIADDLVRRLKNTAILGDCRKICHR